MLSNTKMLCFGRLLCKVCIVRVYYFLLSNETNYNEVQSATKRGPFFVVRVYQNIYYQDQAYEGRASPQGYYNVRGYDNKENERQAFKDMQECLRATKHVVQKFPILYGVQQPKEYRPLL